jgi:TonB-linked SusC/RagA family outer membrane protein
MYNFYSRKFVQSSGCITKILLVINAQILNHSHLIFNRVNKADTRKWMMRINLITFLLFTSFMQVSAITFAQKVTLSEKNTRLEKIFEKISAQTGYDFLFTRSTLKDASPINIDVKNAELNDVLRKIFNGQPLEYSLEDKSVVISVKSKAILKKIASGFQDNIVKGEIIDEKGLPLPGATITIKGTRTSVISNINGQFTLTGIKESDMLVISFLGYVTKEINANKGNLKIILQEKDSQLNEVIVVGYGTQKRGNVVGSVSQIKGEELEKAPPGNITNMLAGRLPGLTALQQSGRPGADDATLRIRGISTYGGNQSPLIMIDGVQRDSFSYLDPSEIESVTLLKDAVSTAVYGLQAANGIILITTKKGKSQKASVAYDGSFTLGQNTRFPKFLNGVDYMEWFNKATDEDNEYLMHTGGNPVPYVYGKNLIANLKNGTNENILFGNTDWINELIGKNSHSQHHAVTVNGGSEDIKFFTSVSHLDQDGVVKNTGFKRYNVRSNVSANLNKILSIDLNLMFRQQNTHTPGISPDNSSYLNPFYQAAMMLPNLPMYAPNGLYTAYRSGPGWVNPLASVEQSGYQKKETNVFQGDLTFKVNIPWVPGLKMQVMAAFDKTGNENKGWLQPYPLMGRDREQKTGSFIPLTTLPGITKTALTQSFTQNNRKTFQPSISYLKSTGDHSINVLALYEWSKYQTSSLTGGARNFALEGLHELDYGSVNPEDIVLPGGSSSINARAGYVGRINYGFKEKYLLELASRYDASVNFPSKHRWELFPAVGIGWLLSKESFIQDNFKNIDYLKFKSSLGKSGNDKISTAFAYLQTYRLSDNPIGVIGGVPVLGLYTSAPPNLDIRWETSTTFNVGFESEWFKGKLGFDAEWFYRTTKDILDSPSGLYPASSGGFFPAFINYGIMENKGVDIQIRHRHHIGSLFYGITGNFNWAKNKIIRRDENASLPYWQRTVGRSYGEKLGFVVDGIYQNWDETKDAVSPSGGVVAPGFFKYRDLNNDGRITRSDDMTFIGRSNVPEMMFGLNFDLKYKNFDLSSFFQGAALSDVALSGLYEGSSGTSGIEAFTVMSRSFYQNGNAPYFLVENSWSSDNPNAVFPRLTAGKAALGAHNAHSSSGYLRNGAYLRLKTLQLGYSLPKQLLSHAKIQKVRFYATASNLFTWDHLKYFDPEMPNVNNGFYPQQKLFSFGLNIVFN